LQVVSDLACLPDFQRFISDSNFVERHNEPHIDSLFGGFVLTDDCKAVVVPVPTDAVDFLLHLQTADFQRLLFSEQVADLDGSSIVISLYELTQSDSHPVTALRNKNLSIFGVLAPGPPFSLLLGLHIVEENAGDCHIDRIVVQFIAHNDDPSAPQPSHLLNMSCFQDILLFLSKSQLPLEVFQTRNAVDGHFVLLDDRQTLRVL
jgi:hypothetical protein